MTVWSNNSEGLRAADNIFIKFNTVKIFTFQGELRDSCHQRITYVCIYLFKNELTLSGLSVCGEQEVFVAKINGLYNDRLGSGVAVNQWTFTLSVERLETYSSKKTIYLV